MAGEQKLQASGPRPEARLGLALRLARQSRGISLRALARRLQRSHSTLVEYERGHRLPPQDVVEAYETELYELRFVCRSICTVPTATLTRPHLTSEAEGGANYPDSGARRRPSGPSCFTAEPGAGRTPKARLTLPDSALKPSTNRAARRLACRGEPDHSRPWRRRTRRWPSTTGPRRIVSLSTRRCGDERSHGPWPGQLGDRSMTNRGRSGTLRR